MGVGFEGGFRFGVGGRQALDIFKKLEQLHANGKSRVKAKWFIAEDDEAMEEAGEEYRMLLTMPFEIVPVAID